MKNKGFTLVELLAVIVILAIIMIIAIPAVLNTMDSARRKSFIEFANKAILKAEEKYTLRGFDGLPVNGVIVYDIVNDLDLSNTGDYKGYVIVDATENDDKGIYVYLYDKMFLLDLKKSNDINVNNLENINGVEPVNNIEVLVNKIGYDSYFNASSSVVNDTTNVKYEFLDKIVIEGHKYINTNVIPSNNIKVELKLNSTSSFDAIFGSRTKMNFDDSFALFGSLRAKDYSNYIAYSTNVSKSLGGNFSGTSDILELSMDVNNIIINGTFTTSFEPTITLNGIYPLYLFTVSNSNIPDGRFYKGTFYSCKIYTGDTLIRNFVPAKKRDTGEEIIFDKVEKKEYPFILHD